MKRYRSHKVVEAAPIANWRYDGSVQVIFEMVGGEEIPAPYNIVARGSPEPGDYLVRYEEGYLSWSPKATFEAGYVAIGLDASPAALWKATRDEWVAFFGADAISRLEAGKAGGNDHNDWVARGMPVGGGHGQPVKSSKPQTDVRALVERLNAEQATIHQIDLRGLRVRDQDQTIAVPIRAWGWLMGECPDPAGRWFGDAQEAAGKRNENIRPPLFWWRPAFRKLVEVAPAVETSREMD